MCTSILASEMFVKKTPQVLEKPLPLEHLDLVCVLEEGQHFTFPQLLQLSPFSRSRLDIPPFLLQLCFLYGNRTLFFFLLLLFLTFSHLCLPFFLSAAEQGTHENSDSASRNPSILPQWKCLLRPWLASFRFSDTLCTAIKWIFFSILKVTIINAAHKLKNYCPDGGIVPTLSPLLLSLHTRESTDFVAGVLWYQGINSLPQQSPGHMLH